MGRRALVGTRDGYVPCSRCRHARLHHERRGAGRCTRIVLSTATDAEGVTRTIPGRCGCPGHTTDERNT